MASLPKPEKCECGNKDLVHEFHPERWVCGLCSKTVLERGSKPQTGICIECDRKKSDGILFKPGKNICMDCYNKYMRDWNSENREEQLRKKKDYYTKNKKMIRDRSNAYWQGSIETFMSDLFHRVKKCSTDRFGKKNRVVEFGITKDDLLDLWKRQDGKCAITGLEMKHQWNSLYSISVDRIDSSRGYTRDNIQLVCKGVNLLKNTCPQQEALAFFDLYFFERLKRLSVETGQPILTAEQCKRPHGDGVLTAVPGSPTVHEYVDAIS